MDGVYTEQYGTVQMGSIALWDANEIRTGTLPLKHSSILALCYSHASQTPGHGMGRCAQRLQASIR